MKFEDRSQEETQRQERCARGDAWKFAKKIYKLNEQDKATLFSLSDEWIMPAVSTIKPEEREVVVDSGASTCGQQERPQLCRIGNRKGLKKSDDGGNSQRRGANKRRGCQRIGFDRDSNASRRYTSVLSLGKLCEDHGYNYHWTSGQKPHLIKHGRKIECNTANYVPFVVHTLQAHLHLHLLHLHRRKP